VKNVVTAARAAVASYYFSNFERAAASESHPRPVALIGGTALPASRFVDSAIYALRVCAHVLGGGGTAFESPRRAHTAKGRTARAHAHRCERGGGIPPNESHARFHRTGGNGSRTRARPHVRGGGGSPLNQVARSRTRAGGNGLARTRLLYGTSRLNSSGVLENWARTVARIATIASRASRHCDISAVISRSA
jgi:hypothetical protein